MTQQEIPLLGGNTSTVVRVGETVRRNAGPWTPAVHSLLRHLEYVGFTGAPRALGIDERGREVLSFLEGECGEYPLAAHWVTDEALVTVRDTGRGLDDEVRSRIFEPFFTTKPDGTGMGLSICRSIIEAHQGRIWAEGMARGAALHFTIRSNS